VTGRPSPSDIELIYTTLTTTKFNEAFKTLIDLKQKKSLSLDDIIRELHKQLMMTNLPDKMKIFLVNRLSEIEYRLAQGSNEKD
jgi:hypothetical protein